MSTDKVILSGLRSLYRSLKGGYAYQGSVVKVTQSEVDYSSGGVSYEYTRYSAKVVIPPPSERFDRNTISLFKESKLIVFDIRGEDLEFNLSDQLVVGSETYDILYSSELVNGEAYEFTVSKAKETVVNLESTQSLLAAEAISAFNVIAVNDDGSAINADKINAFQVVGIAVRDFVVGEPVNFVYQGIVHNPDWDFNTNKLLFLGDAGGILEVVPVDGESVTLGLSLSSNRVLLDIRNRIDLAD